MSLSPSSLIESEAGFTLLELLVASAIIVILSGLSIQSYVIYREDAYHKLAMQMMGQTRTAMEAGKVDSESFGSATMFVETTDPGPATSGDGETIVPGLVLPEDFYLYVWHDPTCATDSCVEDYVITRHCKANQRVVHYKFKSFGQSTIYNAAAPTDC